MKTAVDRQDAIRFWALGALAIILSAGAAFSYLHSVGYGIAAGDLIGLRGREGDVAYAQRWAMTWLVTAVCCLGVSGLSGALATSIIKKQRGCHGSSHVWLWPWLSHSCWPFS